MRLICRGSPAGGLEQRLDGGRLEQGQFAAGKAQTVGEVGIELVAVEAADVMSDDKALAERFVDGHGRPDGRNGHDTEFLTLPGSPAIVSDVPLRPVRPGPARAPLRRATSAPEPRSP